MTAADAQPEMATWIALSAATPAEAYGGWVVSQKADDRPIGALLYGQDSGDITCTELSIEIAPHWRAQGYGREALRLAVRHLQGDRRLPRLSAYIATTNLVSAKLIVACGFGPEGGSLLVADGATRIPSRRFVYSGRNSAREIKASPIG